MYTNWMQPQPGGPGGSSLTGAPMGQQQPPQSPGIPIYGNGTTDSPMGSVMGYLPGSAQGSGMTPLSNAQMPVNRPMPAAQRPLNGGMASPMAPAPMAPPPQQFSPMAPAQMPPQQYSPMAPAQRPPQQFSPMAPATMPPAQYSPMAPAQRPPQQYSPMAPAQRPPVGRPAFRPGAGGMFGLGDR